ncbi:hypothetical protein DSO57_1031181 [Entomophthora muscae]|uniref:Uncharacterized protein n=1 Tax=Entomophthora muscae TaxID=34485 RepID=A0ACC2TNG6_9FUNG|nr:hypothetical protein DSO57_1031181 [Entomophthora muscae]
MVYEICTDDGELKEEVVTILEEAFSRFDADKDEALNQKELDAFATALNGVPFDEDSLKQIKEVFDVTEEGHLTKRGFIEMYELQSGSEPEETIKDLTTLGFDLTKFKE